MVGNIGFKSEGEERGQSLNISLIFLIKKTNKLIFSDKKRNDVIKMVSEGLDVNELMKLHNPLNVEQCA